MLKKYTILLLESFLPVWERKLTRIFDKMYVCFSRLFEKGNDFEYKAFATIGLLICMNEETREKAYRHNYVVFTESLESSILY